MQNYTLQNPTFFIMTTYHSFLFLLRRGLENLVGARNNQGWYLNLVQSRVKKKMDIYKITLRLHDCFDLFSFLCVQNSLKYFPKIVLIQMNLVSPATKKLNGNSALLTFEKATPHGWLSSSPKAIWPLASTQAATNQKKKMSTKPAVLHIFLEIHDTRRNIKYSTWK